MMRKIHFLIPLAMATLMGLTACNKDANNGAKGNQDNLAPVSFSLSGIVVTTKASNSDTTPIEGYNEDKIVSVKYNVYEGSDVTGTPVYEFAPTDEDLAAGVYDVKGAMLLAGEYTVEALVNAEAFTGDLADETDGFSMYGQKALSVTTQGGACTVKVDRNVARVRMVSLTDNSGLGFTYVGLFLSNVVGSCSISGEPSDEESDLWYNKMGRDKIGNEIEAEPLCAVSSLLWRDLGDTFNGEELPMYCYPNFNNNKEEGEPWCARASKLVLVVSLNGAFEYFPVTLRYGVEANHTYDVSLTIKGHGSKDPDFEPHNGSEDFSIVVNPWVGEGTAIEDEL